MADIAVRVHKLGKTFRRLAGPLERLRELVTGNSRRPEVIALEDVTFEVEKGEVLGVLGANGAGKSTLLRILAGVLRPTSGNYQVEGSISSILELGTGFHPELSGRENVYLGGRCLGLSQREIEQKFDQIVDFAELAEVIERPFKTYSSGMQGRLTFATAMGVDPDVLIIDEALSAGDAAFVQKCLARMRQLCRQGQKTILFVTHNSYLVSQLCQRALWLEQGRLRLWDSALEVVRRYDYSVHQAINRGRGEVVEGPSTVFKQGPVEIDKVEFLDQEQLPVSTVRTWDPLTIRVHYRCPGEIPEETLGLALAVNRAVDLESLCQFSSCNVCRDEDHSDYGQQEFRRRPASRGTIEAVLDPLQLTAGDYLFSVGLLANQPGNLEYYEYHHLSYPITVLRQGFPFGAVFYPLVQWHHQPQQNESALCVESQQS